MYILHNNIVYSLANKAILESCLDRAKTCMLMTK